MNKKSRILFLIATLLLIPIYFVPIWHIDLDAPQYPEGIGMYIWIDQITGENPHDLRNINNLNHYIGMKTIEPESIPELKIMPWLIGFLIVSGLTVFALNKKPLAWTWLTLFILLLGVGLVDFYLWEYDYGHNLNPHAAIKIPGMSYQPPLIGTKQLLNMKTTSLPASGGILMGISVMLTMGALYLDRGRRAAKKAGSGVAIAALALLFTSACTPQPEAIRVGEDECAYCRMSISDERYGAELVTNKSKVYKFDSIECLAAHVSANGEGSDDVHSLWLMDFNNPGNWLDVNDAWIVQSENLRSPMGMNLTAVSDNSEAAQLTAQYGGEALRWQETKNLVKSEWLTPQAAKESSKCSGKCGH